MQRAVFLDEKRNRFSSKKKAGTHILCTGLKLHGPVQPFLKKFREDRDGHKDAAGAHIPPQGLFGNFNKVGSRKLSDSLTASTLPPKML